MIYKIFITALFIFSSFSFAAEEFTLHTDSSFTPTFTNHLSGLIGVNPSMNKTNQLQNIHLSYGILKQEKTWWDFNLTYTKGFFDKFTTNNTNATGTSNSTMSNGGQTSTQVAFGAGISYFTNYFHSLLPYQGLYEISSASITYNTYKDTNINKSFSGPGMIAKFSLLKKVSDYVSFGGNFIYNLAVVKRAAETAQESSSNQSLTLSHLTVGFDLSIFL